MKLQVTRSKGILTVGTGKAIDSRNASDFQTALEGFVDDADEAVVLSCEELFYISSAGLRAVLMVARGIRSRRKAFAMCALAGPVRRTFAITGLDRIIRMYPTREDAMMAIGR